jgi:TPP-dependent 2-oxoacid decarboxylase
MPTLGTALLEGLKAYGAREIFGIPGDFVLSFFKVIEESSILPFYTSWALETLPHQFRIRNNRNNHVAV